MEYGREINRERTPERQAYRQSSVAFGVSTHLIRLAGALSPLLILEFVKEPSKAMRWTRVASITAAALNETLGQFARSAGRTPDTCDRAPRVFRAIVISQLPPRGIPLWIFEVGPERHACIG